MKNKIVYSILLVLCLWGWETSANSNNKTRVLLSSPSRVWNYLTDNFDMLKLAFITTFQEAFFGLLIAAVLCFILMITCFFVPRLMKFLMPLMITSQVIPLITLAPLLIILLDDGMLAKTLMSALLCFFPIFVNMANGYNLITPNIHEFLYINNATTFQKIRYVYFTLPLPNIMAGLKVAATLAAIRAIVAEFNGAERGLGKNLFLPAKRLEPELMMSSLFLSALLGALMYLLIYRIERKLGSWYLQNTKQYGL